MTVHGMHREASIEIQASPEAVYDLVADLPRMGEWSPAPAATLESQLPTNLHQFVM